MLSPEAIAKIADELAEADRTKAIIPRITARYPDATIEDSYAIQGVWRDKNLAAGRRLVGRKIGLTSKAMQRSSKIDEPDFGYLFDDMIVPDGGKVKHADYCLPRVEIELAFVLGKRLKGPGVGLTDVMAATDIRCTLSR